LVGKFRSHLQQLYSETEMVQRRLGPSEKYRRISGSVLGLSLQSSLPRSCWPRICHGLSHLAPLVPGEGCKRDPGVLSCFQSSGWALPPAKFIRQQLVISYKRVTHLLSSKTKMNRQTSSFTTVPSNCHISCACYVLFLFFGGTGV
jgi:hypothetical protein